MKKAIGYFGLIAAGTILVIKGSIIIGLLLICGAFMFLDKPWKS